MFVRELARLVRASELISSIEMWLSEINLKEKFYIPPKNIKDGKGAGLTNVSRGGLGHWVSVDNGLIEHYQIITPTTWNISPRDYNGNKGPIEEALIDTKIRDISNPIELSHIVRSFDVCSVCAIHTTKTTRQC